MHFPYRKTERALEGYHGNEQEMPAGELGSTERLEVGEGPPQMSNQGQEDPREIDAGHAGRWGCHEELSGKMPTCMTRCMPD